MKKTIFVLLALSLLLFGCRAVPEEPAPPMEPPIEVVEDPVDIPRVFVPGEYEVEEVYSSYAFKEPLAVVHDGIGSLHVVERRGFIHSIPDDAIQTSGALLDITSVVDTSGSEMGLLGLAFHPEYRNNRYFYVNYTKNGKTFISRFESREDGPADLNSEKVLLSYSQPYSNHNGGTLLFGPDGYLYISSGDGGGSGDPQGNAQNLSNYLGKILRIDVNKEEPLPEIYAYGLRNPWKFSFDEDRDILLAADVGQGDIEEIDIIEQGKNYGWNIFEGSLPYRGSPEDLDDHVLPIYEYNHEEGRSITGGYTYYGKSNPSLAGVYVYGDFISGRIWGLWLDENMQAENYDLLDTDLMISTFGLDAEGEILVADYRGKLYRLIESD
ncbi:MAG: glucose sorbosone dehydrogenase [Firmicutes bacterium HGW-Firmicutes-11]|jgi:glucose/arabinose dehydrogenase|nr:MAG: glucose sorbosone dehydrogenase [Firmicutes bacterium HGW-Firmicutes-11]